ncbi:MAG: homoserine kinase [Desulfitobacterium hafniense]|nr:homoserine kinase [Desulfitobacterium hafniense]
MICVSVPATSANLGPGFDCLGLALTLYNRIIIEENQPFKIKLTGEYREHIPLDETNLVWQTMCHLWNILNYPIPQVSITLENNVPPTRGLGSSSTAIVGGLIAANTLAGSRLSKLELLQIANELEGHPDNVTPALLGGVTLSVETDNGIMPRILAKNPKLSAIAIVPDLLLETDVARNLLSDEVARKDAVYNITHTGLIIEAFLREDYGLLKEGMLDKLHQDKRSSLIPGMFKVIEKALDSGAYGAALSGSGPTLLALTRPGNEFKVGKGMVDIFDSYGIKAKSYYLAIDHHGTRVDVSIQPYTNTAPVKRTLQNIIVSV